MQRRPLATGNNLNRFAVSHWQIGNTALRRIGHDATHLQMTRVGDRHEAYAMKKYAAPVTLGLACIAYGLVAVCMFYFAAQAQSAADACNTDCLRQQVNALNLHSEALEHTVGELTLQVNKSIKSGQAVTLHTQAGHGGGCLTYIGPSGDRGGYVTWNADCSHGTLWTIN